MARDATPKPPQDVLINPIHGPVDPKDRTPVPGGSTGQEGTRPGATTGTPTGSKYPEPPPGFPGGAEAWAPLPEKQRKQAWQQVLGVAGEAVESGGFGGFGGGGGGGAPVDPVVSAGTQIYFRLWGTNAPEGYIERLVKAGLNVYEIEEHERRKPSFRRTKTYRDEATSYGRRLASILGTR